MRIFISKPVVVLAFLALAVLASGGCSPQEKAQDKGQDAAEKQPGKGDADSDDAPQNVADTVYTNGKIYTVNEKQPWAEAVAIKDGKFLVVGSNADVKAVTGDKTKVVDLGGKMAMPGLMDAHHHLLTVADGRSHLALNNEGGKDGLLKQIKEYAEANLNLSFIRGEQWNLGIFPDDSPRKEWLDEIVPDRPAYFLSQSGHSAWVNSKALEMAGITKDTPVTQKFIYDKDSDTGEPTGTIREFAMAAMLQKLPRTPPEKMLDQIHSLSQEFGAAGFTTLKLAEGRPHHVKAAAIAESQGKLTTRLFPSWEWESHYNEIPDDEMAKAIENWKTYKTDLIDPRHVKIFADGSPDTYTSLMYEDYVGRPGFKGTTHRPKEALLKKVTELNSNGIGVIVHAYGDATAGQVIDVFAEVRKTNGNNDAPLHLSHCVTATPSDLKRLAKLDGVMVDFSPVLCYPHPSIRGSTVPPIGEARYQKFFNVRSALEAGLPVGFGSDFPSMLIPEFNGFHQMQSWITRKDPNDPSSGTLNADQAITLEQAIRGFTLGNAQLLGFGWDKKLGSIEAGKLADFIVVDRNVFDMPIEKLYLTQVDRTVLNGKVIFDRDQATEKLAIVEVEITNKELDSAVDAADLNLLVQDELYGGGCRCLGAIQPHIVAPGAASAPDEVNQAFASLLEKGYRYARPAREIKWKDEGTYWIQWTLKQPGTAVLWAYDPVDKKAVEILQVREK